MVWVKSNRKAVELCDSLQNYFWRVMLTVPESCPKIALRCETGMMGMQWRIWLQQVMLVLRIREQAPSSLSRQVYEESIANGWPGLAEEVTTICEEIGIPDVNTADVQRSTIKDAIWNHHQQDLKKELEKSSKLSEVKDDDFSKVQEYFHEKSLYKTRMAFKIRSHMVPEIPGNFNLLMRVLVTLITIVIDMMLNIDR